MLPFLKNKQDSGTVTEVEHQMREPDDDADYDSMHSAAEDLISAIHSKDIKSVAQALRAAFELCDSEPHEEGKHI